MLVTKKEYSGADFNAGYKGKLVCVTAAIEQQGGHQFVSGLNVIAKPFNPYSIRSEEGIKCYYPHPGCVNFCARYPIFENTTLMAYVRDVTILDDAKVYTIEGGCVVDKCVLGDRRLLFPALHDSYRWWYSDLYFLMVDVDDPVYDIAELWDEISRNGEKSKKVAAHVPPNERNVDGAIAIARSKKQERLWHMASVVFSDPRVLAALDEYNVPMAYIPAKAQTTDMWIAAIHNDKRRCFCDMELVRGPVWDALNVDDCLYVHFALFDASVAKYRADNLSFCRKMYALDHRSVRHMPMFNQTKFLTETLRKECIANGWADVLTLFPKRTGTRAAKEMSETRTRCLKNNAKTRATKKRKRRDWSKK